MIERITRVPLRQVWRHEAHDFTAWLQQNLDLLDDYLEVGLSAENVRREQSAGAFWVDLVAEDADGDTVVIENQLGKSDHDHLGKLMTYLAAFEATTAIWIVGDPRTEHVKAVSWLNDSSSAAVYMFKIEAVRIGDSPPAPLLTKIVGPSVEAKQVAAEKGEKSERHRARHAFYKRLLAYASTETDLHAGRSAPDGPYLSASSGVRGVNFDYALAKDHTRALLWIDAGPDADEFNNALFAALRAHAGEIEGAFGGEIDWYAKEGNRSRQLRTLIERGGWSDDETWDEAIAATVETMVRLERALRPFLADAASAAEVALTKSREAIEAG